MGGGVKSGTIGSEKMATAPSSAASGGASSGAEAISAREAWVEPPAMPSASGEKKASSSVSILKRSENSGAVSMAGMGSGRSETSNFGAAESGASETSAKSAEVGAGVSATGSGASLSASTSLITSRWMDSGSGGRSVIFMGPRCLTRWAGETTSAMTCGRM